MLTISTLADVRSILKDFPPEFLSYMESRFHTLYHIYCSNGSPPLGQFSLSSVGEILLAHSYDEICNIIFEEVQKKTIGGDTYCAYRLPRYSSPSVAVTDTLRIRFDGA